jgi:ABC-type branched-subunit amino acid transport system substrate-binding protein
VRGWVRRKGRRGDRHAPTAGRPTLCARSARHEVARTRRHAARLAAVAASSCVLLAASGAATSSPALAKGAKRAVGVRAAPITVGLMSDMTGTYSVMNENVNNGIFAWVKVTDASGGLDGHQVVLVKCDTGSSITGALTCAQKMENVGDVIEENVPGEIAAAIKVLRSEGKVVFTQTPLENPPYGSNLFQVVPSLAGFIKPYLAAGKLSGIRRVGAIVTDDASGIGITAALRGVTRQLGQSLYVQSIASNATSATVQLEQLEADHVGMIFDGGVGSTGIGVLRSMKLLGLDRVPVAVQSGNVSDQFLSAAAGAIPGQVYGVPNSLFSFPSMLTGKYAKAAAAFMAKYKKVTGQPFDTATTSMFGAVLINAAAQLLVDVGPTPRRNVAERYLHTHVLQGLEPLKFPPHGVQDALNVPLRLAEAKSGARQWGPCLPGGPLKCPPM